MKEAIARVKINKLLESAGWRFFADAEGPANITLELHTKVQQSELDALGENFEGTTNGFIDFLLLNEKGFLTYVIIWLWTTEYEREQMDALLAVDG